MLKGQLTLLIKRFLHLFESPGKRFVREWSIALTNHAKVFNGLYASLAKVSGGTSKAPLKILNEWNARTRYNLKDSPCVALMEKRIGQISKSKNAGDIIKVAALLQKSIAQAGIVREAKNTIHLDKSNVNAYIDWDGDPLYLNDVVEVLQGAWYQNGVTIEQGYCKHITNENSEGE